MLVFFSFSHAGLHQWARVRAAVLVEQLAKGELLTTLALHHPAKALQEQIASCAVSRRSCRHQRESSCSEVAQWKRNCSNQYYLLNDFSGEWGTWRRLYRSPPVSLVCIRAAQHGQNATVVIILVDVFYCTWNILKCWIYLNYLNTFVHQSTRNTKPEHVSFEGLFFFF